MAKKEAEEREKRAAAKKAEKPEMWGTKEVAAKLGIEPGALRRYLRSTGSKAEEGEYNRYEWKPNDPAIDKLSKAYKEYKSKADKDKADNAKKKSSKKSGKKKKDEGEGEETEI